MGKRDWKKLSKECRQCLFELTTFFATFILFPTTLLLLLLLKISIQAIENKVIDPSRSLPTKTRLLSLKQGQSLRWNSCGPAKNNELEIFVFYVSTRTKVVFMSRVHTETLPPRTLLYRTVIKMSYAFVTFMAHYVYKQNRV